MTEQELFNYLDAWENIEVITKVALREPELFNTLLLLALNDERQKSWRAAYLVDKIHNSNPELLQPYLPRIIEKLKTEKNASKRRHWLKLISMNKISEEYSGFLFDYCINAFISGSEAVAVRVHAMQILYNISETEPGLKPEVLHLIEQEIEHHPTAGIRSRGKKLAARLFKQIRKNNYEY